MCVWEKKFMALRFRLKGLAETVVDTITCPCCKSEGQDDEFFTTTMTKVTYQGIVVVLNCRVCGEVFVPDTQRLGIINPKALTEAIHQDIKEIGEEHLRDLVNVRLETERVNAERRNSMQ